MAKAPKRASGGEPSHVTVVYDGIELLRMPVIRHSVVDHEAYRRISTVVKVESSKERTEDVYCPAGCWLTLYSDTGGYLKDNRLPSAVKICPGDSLQITLNFDIDARMLA